MGDEYREKGVQLIRNENEIDLKAIFIALWEQRYLISGVVFFCLLLAVYRVITLVPLYRAQAVLLPATDSQIQVVKRLELIDFDSKINVIQLYSVLSSLDTQRDFFFGNKDILSYYYLNSVNDSAAFDLFLSDGISVVVPDVSKSSDGELPIEVTVTMPESIDGVKLLNRFLDYSIKKYQEKIKRDLKGLVEIRIQSMKDSINQILMENRLRRLSRILMLEEAKNIAVKLGLVEPATISILANKAAGNSAGSIVTSVGEKDNALYLLGAKFLAAEINALENRRDDSLIDSRIAKLMAEISTLENLEFDHLAVSGGEEVFYLANKKSSPHKDPKKFGVSRRLILFLGLFIGVILGLFASFVRHILK